MTDPIRQPAHYRADSGIEAIDVIRAWSLSFSLGSSLKYLCRAGLKPGQSARQDLQKALWYVAEELGGKSLANEVAQLVAMEMAERDESVCARLPEPAEEEPEPATHEGRTLADYHPAPAPLAVTVPVLVDVTPDVTSVGDDLTIESVEAPNQPAPMVTPPAPRAVRSQPKPAQPLSDGEITTEGAAKLLGVSTGRSATKYLLRRGISPLRPGNNNRPHVWDRAQVEAVAGVPQPSASEAARATRARMRAEIAAQGLVSSQELAQRAGISPAGIVWNVNHGNLTPQIDAKRGHSHWFTEEEADRFLASRTKPSKGRKVIVSTAAPVSEDEKEAEQPAPPAEELAMESASQPETDDADTDAEAEERIPTAPGAQAHKTPAQDDATRTNGYAMEAAIRRGREAFAVGGVFTLYVRPAPDSPSFVHYKAAAPRDDAAMREAGWKPIVRLIRKRTGQWDEVPVAAHNGHERNVPVVATAPREHIVGDPLSGGEGTATSATLRRIA